MGARSDGDGGRGESGGGVSELNESHCRAELRAGIQCGRHAGHDRERGDSGHRQRSVDGGATWPSAMSTFAGAERFGMWLRGQGTRALVAEDNVRAQKIAVIAGMIDALFPMPEVKP